MSTTVSLTALIISLYFSRWSIPKIRLTIRPNSNNTEEIIDSIYVFSLIFQDRLPLVERLKILDHC